MTVALNPPFDPRMRRIGSPLNQTAFIKRGWIQKEDTGERVNFLFNPSELDLSHTVDPSAVAMPDQRPPEDHGDPYYVGSGSTTGVKLLYDRTYEMFSGPKDDKDKSLANRLGVWADMAAWYKFLGMIDAMPTNWSDGIIAQPPQLFTSWLFVGPKLVYYGWVTGISVVYSHWTGDMIPVRGAVDVSFQILPYTGDAPERSAGNIPVDPNLPSWLGGNIDFGVHLPAGPDGTIH